MLLRKVQGCVCRRLVFVRTVDVLEDTIMQAVMCEYGCVEVLCETHDYAGCG